MTAGAPRPRPSATADDGGRLTGSVLLRGLRPVPVHPPTPAVPPARPGAPAPAGPAAGPVDLRVVDGAVTAVGPRLERAPGEELLEAEGRWVIPGLWDHHVHLGQWAGTSGRLDVSAARSAAEVVALVRERLATHPDRRALVGFGFRDALWPDVPSLAALDAVAGALPVVLVSGDVHCGWLSSAARASLGLPPAGDDDGLVRETPWFDALGRVPALTGAVPDRGYAEALERAAAMGIVGLTELEFGANELAWPERIARGLDLVRVRTGVYPDRLEEVLAAGLRTGAPLPGARGLATMGPLKIISDGALNTRTAHCRAPYPEPGDPGHPHGQQSVPAADLERLLRRAAAGGLAVAVHAIGDAAVALALDALEATGARGSIEHAQLVDPADVPRMAALGVVASVQPAHLLDDRDVAETAWPGRTAHAFPLRELLDAGVTLALGSDAPVAALDPWLAMAAAVHRSADERAPWHPEQQLTAAQALAASTDGRGTPAPGSPADLVLLDADPLAPGTSAEVAERLRTIPVAATLVAGRLTHRAL
ncbi:amidohydrolase [Georgenia sp. AZ-5]|uniref:amidohydrolase n=1 Tax=Georgenia sp. AZ-5 TaxID=3367526 RepID=UPI0037548C62